MQFRTFVGSLLFAGLLVLSNPATATFDYNIDVFADPGVYTPITLGEDLTLDACGSTVHRNTTGGPSFGLCTLASVADFTLTWQISQAGVTNVLGTFTGATAASGLTPTFSTGPGSLFTAPGSYLISLVLILDSSAFVTLPSGAVGLGGGDCGIVFEGVTYAQAGCDPFAVNQPQVNGIRDAGIATTTVVVNPAVTVPEPAAALLLIPVLTLVAVRRQRKHKIQIYQ